MATVEQLKELLIENRLTSIRLSIPNGHCPYAYYHIEQTGTCEDLGCAECHRQFMQKMRTLITEEVNSL